MPIVYADELERLPLPPPARARTVFAAPGLMDGVWRALEDRAVGSDGGFRLVAIRYGELPPLKALIDDAIDRLADVALTLFPDWIGGESEDEGEDKETEGESASRNRGVLISWRKAAWKLCRLGEPPRPRSYSPAIHAEQLALALDAEPFLLALIVEDEAPAPEALLGLARAGEWLAGRTGARVALILPESLAKSSALDSVNFEATHVRAKTPAPVVVDDDEPEPPRVSIWPLIGRPNPSSRGEMMLADRLEDDDELAGLFRYNVHVPTVRGTKPLVDLAWEAGRVVVEVDGYYHHSDEAAFKHDRKRDYELLISGWIVLRLPHDDVVHDVEMAVDKIRDVVKFRQGSLRPHPEHQR